METDHIRVASIDEANDIIKIQDRLLGQMVRENAALKVKADLYDDLMTVRKLLDDKFPDKAELYKSNQ